MFETTSMDTIMCILDIVGYIGTAVAILTAVIIVVAWAKGIAPVLWRLGMGLARRRITIFASSDSAATLKKALVDSGLFQERNIEIVTQQADVGSGEGVTLFLLHWKDASQYVSDVLRIKKPGCYLVVYAPTDEGRVPDEAMALLAGHRNTSVTNFRGRLLSDVVMAMITTSYEKG